MCLREIRSTFARRRVMGRMYSRGKCEPCTPITPLESYYIKKMLSCSLSESLCQMCNGSHGHAVCVFRAQIGKAPS